MRAAIGGRDFKNGVTLEARMDQMFFPREGCLKTTAPSGPLRPLFAALSSGWLQRCRAVAELGNDKNDDSLEKNAKLDNEKHDDSLENKIMRMDFARSILQNQEMPATNGRSRL